MTETGMTIATTGPFPYLYGNLQPLVEWQAAWFDGLMQAQKLQLEMLSAWRNPLVMNQEMFDQWIAHFGGGVPIDG
jgi:hypothetical protein